MSQIVSQIVPQVCLQEDADLENDHTSGQMSKMTTPGSGSAVGKGAGTGKSRRESVPCTYQAGTTKARLYGCS